MYNMREERGIAARGGLPGELDVGKTGTMVPEGVRARSGVGTLVVA